ncbi:ABC transporter substrate-binding protein [Paenibacillus sp. strain BS8-2]
MKKRHLLLLLAVMMMIAVLSACGSNDNGQENAGSEATNTAEATATATATATPEPEKASEPRKLTDELGHELEIPAKPERIIATGLEDFLAALDVVPQVKYPYDYLDEWMGNAPEIAFSPGLTPEVALSYDPELIIIGYDAGAAQYDAFKNVAPTYSFANAWAGSWRDVLVQIGDIVGRKDVAEQKLAEYDAKVAEARAKIEEVAGADPKLALIYVGKTLWTLSEDRKDNLYGDTGLGLAKPALVEKHGSAEISLELIPELADADYIIIEPDTGNVEIDAMAKVEELKQNPLFADLPAVKAGNVHIGMPAIWRGNGPISNSLVVDEVLKTIVKE